MNARSQSEEATMRDLERISFGPIQAEGRRPTTFVMVLITFALVVGFATGKLSAVLDACFGLKPF